MTDAPAPPADEAEPGNQFADPAVRNYLIVGGAALAVYFLTAADRGGPLGSLIALLVLVVAGPGLVMNWSVAPGMFLLLTTYMVIDPAGTLLTGQREPGTRARTYVARMTHDDVFLVSDLLLCGASFAYLMAQYRLSSLMALSLPQAKEQRSGVVDLLTGGLTVGFVAALVYFLTAGQRAPALASVVAMLVVLVAFAKKPRGEPVTRPAAAVPPKEIPQTLIAGAAFVVAAQLAAEVVWWASVRAIEPGESSPPAAQFHGTAWLIAAFGLTGAGLVAAFVLGYLRAERATADEAAMHLRDVVWRDTHREQRRMNAWRAWARRRYGTATTKEAGS